jgi:hypothetical protein
MFGLPSSPLTPGRNGMKSRRFSSNGSPDNALHKENEVAPSQGKNIVVENLVPIVRFPQPKRIQDVRPTLAQMLRNVIPCKLHFITLKTFVGFIILIIVMNVLSNYMCFSKILDKTQN